MKEAGGGFEECQMSVQGSRQSQGIKEHFNQMAGGDHPVVWMRKWPLAGVSPQNSYCLEGDLHISCPSALHSFYFLIHQFFTSFSSVILLYFFQSVEVCHICGIYLGNKVLSISEFLWFLSFPWTEKRMVFFCCVNHHDQGILQNKALDLRSVVSGSLEIMMAEQRHGGLCS